MSTISHGQGQCPKPNERLRVVGDYARRAFTLCADCRAVYEASPFNFTFIPADAPEWVARAAEHRLPTKAVA